MTDKRRKPELELPAPWIAPPLPEAIIYAIQALNQGKASEGQQRNFLRWLIFDMCLIGKTAFHPGAPGIDGDRVTAFAEGLQQPARVIAAALEVQVKPPDPRGPPPET